MKWIITILIKSISIYVCNVYGYKQNVHEWMNVCEVKRKQFKFSLSLYNNNNNKNFILTIWFNIYWYFMYFIYIQYYKYVNVYKRTNTHYMHLCK